MSSEFVEFSKTPRLSRDVVVTEKLDGTNGQVFICDKLMDQDYSKAVYDNGAIVVMAGSRNRWVTPSNDNFGFARWVADHADELIAGLGVGRHFGEWWGSGIGRRYDQKLKQFSLFNTLRWHDRLSVAAPKQIPQADPRAEPKWSTAAPACCSVVPELYRGPFDTGVCDALLEQLRERGSVAAPGFMKPEGIIVFHTGANHGFKKTLDDDGVPKSKARGAAA